MARYYIMILAVATLSFYSCNRNYNTGIYRTGRAWNFEVYFFDAQNRLADSCSLQLTIGKGGLLSFAMNQRELKYTYGKCCGKELSETTGVDERGNYVFIHPPRSACLSFTEVPPMPEINLPVNMTSVSTGEIKILKSEMNGLAGKTIKQKSRVVKMDTFSFADTTIKCVETEGENTNYTDEIGLYKSAYLFNEYYGFVQLSYYKPTGESVKIILKTVNFR
jgi:hypothetical protein